MAHGRLALHARTGAPARNTARSGPWPWNGRRPDGWLTGGSFFSNSFGQDCAYVYVGERYTGFWGEPQLFAQWSAGVIYGYRGKYEDKLPLNTKGFAPGALVSLGWNFDRRSSVAAHLLGDAGVMLQMSYEFR